MVVSDLSNVVLHPHSRPSKIITTCAWALLLQAPLQVHSQGSRRPVVGAVGHLHEVHQALVASFEHRPTIKVRIAVDIGMDVGRFV